MEDNTQGYDFEGDIAAAGPIAYQLLGAAKQSHREVLELSARGLMLRDWQEGHYDGIVFALSMLICKQGPVYRYESALSRWIQHETMKGVKQ